MTSETRKNARWLIRAIADGLRTGHGGEPGVADVLARLAAQDTADPAALAPQPQVLPACRHLPEAAAMAMFSAPAAAAALAALEEDLRWVQNPGYAGDRLLEDYAYCELIGPQGFFPGDDFLLGLIIIGPERIYRDHFHRAPELYWLLTGPTDWSHAYGHYAAFEAGDTLWHPPELVHATRTLHAPLLAVWAWTCDVREPARFAPVQSER